MSFTILQAANFPAELRQKIDSSVNVIGPFGLPVGAILSLDEAATVRVLITMGTLITDAAVMDRLPNLGLVCCYGTGYEGVDLDAARKRGIMVTHSPAANAASVADLAMALLLAVTRRVAVADKFVRGRILERPISCPHALNTRADWPQNRCLRPGRHWTQDCRSRGSI